MDHEENIDPIPEDTEKLAADEPAYGEPEDSGEPKEPKGRSGWVIVGIGGLIVLLIAAVAALAGGTLSDEETAPTEPAGGANAFISIVQPGQGAVLPVPESVPIRGQAGGRLENSLVVQAFDS